ncbi:hypothetical protein B9Z32_07585 [Limnohabitans sp. MMS-10A-178]|nr:hypothetical protein B9Z32_07585 [Limnohabitans sp. MMS-10A-178]
MGRFFWSAWMALGFSLLSMLSLAFYFWFGWIEGWPLAWLSGAWFLLSLYAVVSFKQLSPKAWLCWTGHAWEVQLMLTAPSQVEHAISVHLDFQNYFLVSLSNPHSARQWFWVSRKAFPERWHGFRCAVYSRSERISF